MLLSLISGMYYDSQCRVTGWAVVYGNSLWTVAPRALTCTYVQASQGGDRWSAERASLRRNVRRPLSLKVARSSPSHDDATI